MIKGKIRFLGPDAHTVQKALDPDNLTTMHSEKTKNGAVIEFRVKKISTLIATVDDYLMNAKIAEELCRAIKK